MDEISLLVNGNIYFGWKTVSVKRSFKAISSSFSLSVTDQWSHLDKPWIIRPGDQAVIKIGKDQIITGYVDDVDPSFDKDNRTITIEGRDKTADFVDCSADHKPGQWANLSLTRLAQILGAPFGLSATALVDVGAPFPNVKIQNGESAFECLDRQARLRGVMVTTDGMGNIVLTRATKTARASTDLIQGINVLTGSAKYSYKERFSRYKVKGQSLNTEGETDAPEVDLAVSATAEDDGVNRFRPLVIVAEGVASIETARTRARWERSVRAAKSSKFNCSVQGWRQGDGRLWTCNELVNLKSPWLGTNIELLITEIEFSKSDNGGTVTQLGLERADAYTIDPTLTNKKDPLRELVVKESKR